MIGELIAIAVVVVLPATIGLGMLGALALTIAGVAADADDRRLVRPLIGQRSTTGPASRMDADAPSA